MNVRTKFEVRIASPVSEIIMGSQGDRLKNSLLCDFSFSAIHCNRSVSTCDLYNF